MYTQYFWQDKIIYNIHRTKILLAGQNHTYIYIGIYIIYIYRQDKNTVGRTKPHTYIYRFDQLRRGVVC